MEIASSSLLRDFMKTVFTILEGGEIFVIQKWNYPRKELLRAR